jgi:peptidoglycan/xylan/chitin deacetylase (PgdA/CDA1 family)
MDAQLPPRAVPVARPPQFVCMTFDDGFGLEDGGVGGVDDIVDFCERHRNPAGSGQRATFDGCAPGMTLYLTTKYGAAPENLRAWTRAHAAGIELGNHSADHPNGGAMASGTQPPRNFDRAAWRREIARATDFLTGPEGVVGLDRRDVRGFRAPYLCYNQSLFAALVDLGFRYDSSLLTSFGDHEDGRDCRWPYRLDQGSVDADELHARFALPRVAAQPGLWEVPVSTLFAPPDRAGRLAEAMPYPSLTDGQRGKIAGLDYALLIHNQLPPADMTALLKHTLELRLQSNRAPLVFAAHTFMYAYGSPGNDDNTSSLAVRDRRWLALVDFLEYALARPEVRLCCVRDVVAWMESPVALEAGARTVA